MKTNYAPDPILRVRGLTTQFKQSADVIVAVNDVSFELQSSQRIAIVGESGSGKSSLALSLVGLIEPPGAVVNGNVWCRGRQIVPGPERALCRVRGKEIALIFQDPTTALDPVKTIGDQISEAIRQHQAGLSRRSVRTRVVELLKEVEIPRADRRLDDYPHEYSGGMRQRVMIAIALANEPQILIADEPTTALDVTTQAQIMAVLNRLVTQRGTAVILITHNLGLVAGFCDEVYVMYAGRFVERAQTQALFERPGHPYSRALIQSVPRPDLLARGPLKAIPGAPPLLARLPAGCSFEPRCPVGHGREVCRSQRPPRIETGHESWAECHFATSEPDPRAAALPDAGTDRSIGPRPYRAAQGPLLSVDSLRVTFGAKRSWRSVARPSTVAVDGLSFDIYRGETFGLVGESGCGKSTVARAIVGLVRPDSGRVVFDGIQVSARNKSVMRRLRARMQIVFQDPFSSLDPRMSAREIVEEPLRIHGIDNSQERHRRVREMLQMVGLAASHEDHMPHEFSGGQRQRLAIARALVLKPELVILDEPVSALDVSIQAQVLNLLKDLQRQVNLTYLFIIHDLAVAEYFCDRLAVLHAGSAMEVGDRETIFRARAHPYTTALLSAVPIPDPSVERRRIRIVLAGEVTNTQLIGCKFQPRCPVGRDLIKCAEVRPPLTTNDPRHEVACHFPGSLTLQGVDPLMIH